MYKNKVWGKNGCSSSNNLRVRIYLYIYIFQFCFQFHRLLLLIHSQVYTPFLVPPLRINDDNRPTLISHCHLALNDYNKKNQVGIQYSMYVCLLVQLNKLIFFSLIVRVKLLCFMTLSSVPMVLLLLFGCITLPFKHRQ